MMIALDQPGTSLGIVLQMIGSLNTVPPRMFRIVPLGLSHIFFSLNSAKSAVVPLVTVCCATVAVMGGQRKQLFNTDAVNSELISSYRHGCCQDFLQGGGREKARKFACKLTCKLSTFFLRISLEYSG